MRQPTLKLKAVMTHNMLADFKLLSMLRVWPGLKTLLVLRALLLPRVLPILGCLVSRVHHMRVWVLA